MSIRKFKEDQFEIYEQLGRGAFGVVYRAFDKVQKMDVAVKQVDLESSDEMSEIEQEIRMLSTCHNEYVTRYYGCFLKGSKLWIIMEYLGGGSCSDLLEAGPFAEKEIGLILYQILQGLEYLHSHGKIHRDIKAANILVGNTGDVKIADFGVATQLSNNLSKRNTFVGTPYWMAPEIIKHKEYTFTADIWSLGITAIELAYGKPPLSQYHPFDVLFRITDDPPPTLGSSFSDEFNSFVNNCLQKDPQRRPSAKELLKHKFICKYAKSDRQILMTLIRKKVQWDFESGNVDMKYYIPSNVPAQSTLKTPFDLGTITQIGYKKDLQKHNQESRNSSQKSASEAASSKQNVKPSSYTSDHKQTIKLVPQSPLKRNVNVTYDDDHQLRKEMNSILNQSFNKISHKFDLSTYEYDNLARFQTTLMDSLFLDEDHRYREVFAKFLKLILKRVMKSNDPALKERIMPRYYCNMEHEWTKMEAKKQSEQKQINGGIVNGRDEVEELLLTRWAEGMLDKGKI